VKKLLAMLMSAAALAAFTAPALADAPIMNRMTDDNFWNLAAMRTYQDVCKPTERLSPEALEMLHRAEMTAPDDRLAPIHAAVAEEAKKKSFCLYATPVMTLMISASNKAAPLILRDICLAQKPLPSGRIAAPGDYVLVNCRTGKPTE
jgi:hypothetical protein